MQLFSYFPNLFLAFILLFYALITWFVAFFSMFLALSCSQHVLSLDPCSSMLVYMLFVLIYMFYALCHALDFQIFSFACVDVWVYMLTFLILCPWPCLAQIYMFVCMLYASMPMSMPSHACMLGFVFFHPFMLTSTCLDAYLHAYIHIFPHICVDQCVYMLRSMFSTCFILFSTCLCTPCHVCVPRPRL